MIEVINEQSRLVLEYFPDNFSGGVSWVDHKLKEDGEVTFGRTFTFSQDQLLVDPDIELEHETGRRFLLALLEGDYFRIDKSILNIQFDLLLHKSLNISKKFFVAIGNVSIFRKIDHLIAEPIIVGGDMEGAIPLKDFYVLLRVFPTKTTLEHYAHSRISRILKDYFGTMSDAERKLEDHLNRNSAETFRRDISERDEGSQASPASILDEYEIIKFEYIRDKMTAMLKESEPYKEKDWQRLIVKLLLLIFPKYVAVLENLQIKDYYSSLSKTTDRFIDLTLVDANGNIDIIEIKKPFSNCLLSTSPYRDNYIPKKELSGAVMQVEKYVFHLNKWGVEGEREINRKRAAELPPGMQIKIANPKAMIILGRDKDFAAGQKFDFEIIKRKYANIVDIMTYDDLLQRLENIIAKFK